MCEETMQNSLDNNKENFVEISSFDTEVIFDNEDDQLNPSANSNNERVYPVKSIKVERGFYTTFELKRKYDKQPSLVILDSDFQRENVWKLQQKRELIESILMGLPLPIFYFNEDKMGKLIVIDGRQRLDAIFSYMNGDFALDKLKILDEFNKKKFKDLDPIYQSKIEDYQIMAHVIQPATPDRVKFDIFDRVNRAGTQLNKQEIRNALYQGKSTLLLNRLCNSNEFNEATENYFLKDTRMKNRYLLLRFIAFYLLFNKKIYKSNGSQDELYSYNGDIDELLGLAMEFLNNCSDYEIDQIEKTTITALTQITFYLGYNAFRLLDVNKDGTIKRYPININIFECFMYAMTLLPIKNHQIKDKVMNYFSDLKNDIEFRESLNNHRDSDVKVKLRSDKINKIVGDFL